MLQLLLVGNDLHCPATQHEGGANQHRIADLGSGGDAVLNLGHGTALGTGDIQLVQQVFESVPVLGLVDGGAVGADDLHTPVM